MKGQLCFSCADLQADLERLQERNDAEALRDLTAMVEERGARIAELEEQLKKMTREMRDMRKALATRDIPGYNPQYEERIRHLEARIEEKARKA